MPQIDEVVLWPSEENYPRFVEVSEGVVPTYAEFVARAQPIVDDMRAAGCNVIIVNPDPDQMAEWCWVNFGKVDSTARAAYGAFVALNEPSEDDSVH